MRSGPRSASRARSSAPARIPDDRSCARAAEVARRYAGDAAKLGAARIEVLVTAPGAPEQRTGASSSRRSPPRRGLPVRAAQRRGRGAARLRRRGLEPVRAPPGSSTVVDVGGGSTQLVFGTGRRARSGSGRSTSARCGSRRRFLAHDPPRDDELDGAAVERRAGVRGPDASPYRACAVATGGTARALRRRRRTDARARSSSRRPRPSSARRPQQSSPRGTGSALASARRCWPERSSCRSAAAAGRAARRRSRRPARRRRPPARCLPKQRPSRLRRAARRRAAECSARARGLVDAPTSRPS